MGAVQVSVLDLVAAVACGLRRRKPHQAVIHCPLETAVSRQGGGAAWACKSEVNIENVRACLPDLEAKERKAQK